MSGAKLVQKEMIRAFICRSKVNDHLLVADIPGTAFLLSDAKSLQLFLMLDFDRRGIDFDAVLSEVFERLCLFLGEAVPYNLFCHLGCLLSEFGNGDSHFDMPVKSSFGHL